MIERKKVIIGLSGGVDSATCVDLLKEAGYDPIGLTLKMLPDAVESICSSTAGFRVCCSKEAVMEAKLCAVKLGVAHYVIDCSRDFECKIIDYFTDSYRTARTPNPCVFCNKYIKFYYLIKYAAMMGIDYVSSGHYADIAFSEKYGRRLIRKPIDAARDQSYMLCMLPFEYIEKIILPLGAYSKNQTRERALKLGLIVADKPDSQEICFVPDGDYAGFIAGRSNDARGFYPGDIIDENGNFWGRHKGLIHYTIGQRRGLGVANKDPLYVTKLDVVKNEVVVSEAAGALKHEFYVSDFNWHSLTPAISDYEYTVKIRYQHKAVNASINIIDGGRRAKITLAGAERGITPGQILAVYDGDFLIGGAVID